MVQQITPSQLKAQLDAGASPYLLDVREPSEYAIARIDGSVLIPMSEIVSRLDEIREQDGRPIVVICHHGVRSLRAAMFLAQQGLANVASLSGGIDAWSVQVDPAIRRY